MDVIEDGESAITKAINREKTRKPPFPLPKDDSKDKDQDTDTEEKNN